MKKVLISIIILITLVMAEDAEGFAKKCKLPDINPENADDINSKESTEKQT